MKWLPFLQLWCTISYAVFSDELCQDKVNAYAFNSAILEKVKEVTSVKTVLYGSDGAGSQLKNHYNLASFNQSINQSINFIYP